ncbi:MAG: serine protease [Candidatus Electrothrix sp. MAN1_4]|nr:serine protease [Candidatus Electrothrix sp. MAN1_4]
MNQVLSALMGTEEYGKKLFLEPVTFPGKKQRKETDSLYSRQLCRRKKQLQLQVMRRYKKSSRLVVPIRLLQQRRKMWRRIANAFFKVFSLPAGRARHQRPIIENILFSDHYKYLVIIMHFFMTSCCTVLSLLLLCGEASSGNNIEFLEKKFLQDLNHGIYEVVMPKLEDDKITYAEKLPFEKLPYAERIEKYHSIGTAFFISEKELMTAEHVFDLTYFSLHKDFFIRDSKGETYPVNNILKCSSQRDMVVFDLKKYPEKVIPLRFDRQVEVGDTVFSAGNALGEGISYRAGQVASFTPELFYGEWQDIRFSSPASPGNSGGPLLNTAGEVVGLIVQRRNWGENYNVAVPISETDNLADKAEFDERNVRVGISGTTASLSRDWSYTAALPAVIPELAQQAQAALSAFYRTLRKELQEQVKEKNFPTGQRFRYYLREQPIIRGLAQLTPDIKFRKWAVRQVELKKEPLADGQNVYHGPFYHYENSFSRPSYTDMMVIVEKPKEAALKEFLDSPTMLLETVLDAVPYFRYVGRERVAVTSLGEPEKTETWRDKLGRRWTSSLWYIPYNDDVMYSSCLPFPGGAVCSMTNRRASLLTQDYIAASRESCNELVVGYKGSLEDWEEYLALGEKYLPSFFDQAEIIGKKGRAEIRLQDFQMNFDHPEITDDTSLRLHLGYANDQLLGEDLVLFSLSPEKGNATSYTIEPFFEPSPFDSEQYSRTWKESITGTGDFSGKKIIKGSRVVFQQPVAETKKTIAAPDGEKIQKIFTLGCTYRASTAEEKDVEQDCERFFQSVEFTEQGT